MLLKKQHIALGHVSSPVATDFFQHADGICLPSLPEGFLQNQGSLLPTLRWILQCGGFITLESNASPTQDES